MGSEGFVYTMRREAVIRVTEAGANSDLSWR
jgi:hypothetical protein